MYNYKNIKTLNHKKRESCGNFFFCINEDLGEVKGVNIHESPWTINTKLKKKKLVPWLTRDYC